MEALLAAALALEWRVESTKRSGARLVVLEGGVKLHGTKLKHACLGDRVQQVEKLVAHRWDIMGEGDRRSPAAIERLWDDANKAAGNIGCDMECAWGRSTAWSGWAAPLDAMKADGFWQCPEEARLSEPVVAGLRAIAEARLAEQRPSERTLVQTGLYRDPGHGARCLDVLPPILRERVKAAAGDEAERELREGWEVVAGKAGKRKAQATPPASEVSRVRREASEAAVQGLYVPTESETEYVHAALREIEAATEEPEEMWRARGASGPRPGLRGNNVMGCSLHYATAHEAGRLGPIHGDDSGPPSAVVVVSLSCGGCVPPFVVTVEDREAARRASYLACREMRWRRVLLHDSLVRCAFASGAVCSSSLSGTPMSAPRTNSLGDEIRYTKQCYDPEDGRRVCSVAQLPRSTVPAGGYVVIDGTAPHRSPGVMAREEVRITLQLYYGARWRRPEGARWRVGLHGGGWREATGPCPVMAAGPEGAGADEWRPAFAADGALLFARGAKTARGK